MRIYYFAGGVITAVLMAIAVYNLIIIPHNADTAFRLAVGYFGAAIGLLAASLMIYAGVRGNSGLVPMRR